MSLRMNQSMTNLTGSATMTTLAGSTLGKLAAAGTEQRPRMLHQPDSFPDGEMSSFYQTGGKLDASRAKLSASPEAVKPYSKAHGNAKPQEAPFESTWSLTEKEPRQGSWKISVHKNPRMVNHMHAKPWSSSSCPGKQEGETNVFRRQWQQENGTRTAKWGKAEKKAFYDKQDKELFSKAPHDELFAKNGSNYRLWTHLLNEGLNPGGQDKCSYTYEGANTATTHFYKGKFENVKHCQRIVQSGWTDPVTHQLKELHKDTRPMFDNRLLDDARKRTEENNQWAAQANFDTMRPLKSASCTQLGAMFTHR